MDSNAGLADGFVATMLVYVTTLPFSYVSSGFVVDVS